MGLLDRLRGKAKDTATEHGDKIDSGLDKAGEFVDRKTGGKHSDKIDSGIEKTKDGLDKFTDTDEDRADGQDGTNRPNPPSST